MNRQQLIENIKEKHSFLCVGLDTDVKKTASLGDGEGKPNALFQQGYH